jgi:hypothetical protein
MQALGGSSSAASASLARSESSDDLSIDLDWRPNLRWVGGVNAAAALPLTVAIWWQLLDPYGMGMRRWPQLTREWQRYDVGMLGLYDETAGCSISLGRCAVLEPTSTPPLPTCGVGHGSTYQTIRNHDTQHQLAVPHPPQLRHVSPPSHLLQSGHLLT